MSKMLQRSKRVRDAQRRNEPKSLDATVHTKVGSVQPAVE
jgi:hypothetical protein